MQINDDFELLFTSSCQIIGDALIRKKTIKMFDKSVDLEGAAPSVLYHTVLKYLMLLKENYPIDSFLLDYFIAHIKSAILFAKVSELNDHRILSLITSKLLELIVNDLAEGDSIIFPHGYSGTPGHATIMEIKKLPDSKVLLNYFNTGEGLEYHAQAFNPLNPLEKKFSHKFSLLIPAEELNFQFWTLFNSFFKRNKSLNEKYNWSMKDVYTMLLGRLPSECIVKNFDDDENDIFITGQISGTCAYKSLLTWMRSKFPCDEDYQVFKLALKAEAFKAVDISSIQMQRKGLHLLIDLAEEIERDSQYLRLTKYHEIAYKIGCLINGRKRVLSDLLSVNRINPPNEFSTIKSFQ